MSISKCKYNVCCKVCNMQIHMYTGVCVCVSARDTVYIYMRNDTYVERWCVNTCVYTFIYIHDMLKFTVKLDGCIHMKCLFSCFLW